MYKEHYWRKIPYLYRQLSSLPSVNLFSTDEFDGWVSLLPHMRVFVDNDVDLTSSIPYSRLIPQSKSLELLKRLKRSNEKFTVLINDVDTICQDVVNLRKVLGVPFHWRVDDVVATYSTQGSGIGYHAGHEDAIIFQASGKRHWKVWSSNEVVLPLRRRILMSESDDRYQFPPPKNDPIIDCILNEGDAIYIPAFCPHEGVTEEESVSIAFGWKGITYYHFVQAFNPYYLAQYSMLDNMPERLFELVTDFRFENKKEDIESIIDQVIKNITEDHIQQNEVDSLRNKLFALFSA